MIQAFLTRLLPVPAAIALALLLLSISAPSAFAQQEVIDQLNTLIEEQRFQEAYLLAQENLFENEGLPEFDFLYGLAALETANPDEAVFAFERVAYTFPDQRRVKLELARAYYMSNNLTAAEDLFIEVLETNPAPNVVANIEAFLEAIEARQSQVESSMTWFVNSNVGSDSNINSATELNVIPTPIGDIELSANGQSIDDQFMDIGGGFNYTYPLNKNRALTLNGTLNQRNNFDTSQFDLSTVVGEGSFINVVENHRFTQSVRYQKVFLDDNGFQNSASLVSGWQRSGNNGWTQSITGALTAVRYNNSPTSPNNDLRDVNQGLISGVLGHSLGNFVYNISVYLGDEDIQNQQGKNNAQSFYGMAYSQQYQILPGHIPFMRLSVHKSDNKARDPVFNIDREDSTFSTTLGWLWQFNSRLNINTDITYTENDSNINLYEYDRFRYQTGIRYQF